MPSVSQLFLSCVSSELKEYRTLLANNLNAIYALKSIHQECFDDSDGCLLDHLDEQVKKCDRVVHLIGAGTGNLPKTEERVKLLERYPDLPGKLGWLDSEAGSLPVDSALISYTQWEYWLGMYHQKPCLAYKVLPEAPREKKFVPTPEQTTSQERHLNLIRRTGRYRGEIDCAWQLVARVMLYLLNRHPELGTNVSEHGRHGAGWPAPVIVVGVQPAGSRYSIRAVIRWRGKPIPLCETHDLDIDDNDTLTDSLTTIIERGAGELLAEHPQRMFEVELVLPTNLLFGPSDRWRIKDFTFDSDQPTTQLLRQAHRMRLRHGDRWRSNSSVYQMNVRLQLLDKDLEASVGVCWPCEQATSAPQDLPASVVHDADGDGGASWCRAPGVVCAGFTRKPRLLTQRIGKGRGPVRLAPIHEAIGSGIPFLIWPNRDRTKVDPEEMRSHLTDCRRPESLCEYVYRRPHLNLSVLAECRERPFPAEVPMQSDVLLSAEVNHGP